MGSLPILLRFMAHLSVAVAAGVIVMNLAGTMMLAGSPWEAVNRLWQSWSPFNLRDVFAFFAVVALPIALYALSNWADKHS